MIAWTVTVFSADAVDRVSTRRGSGKHMVVCRVFAADAVMTLVAAAMRTHLSSSRLFVSTAVAGEHFLAVVDTHRPLSLVGLCRAMTACSDRRGTSTFLVDDV